MSTLTPPTDADQTGDPYPVDSTTRTCCGGIGDHTPDCPPALRFFDTEPVNLDPEPEIPPEIARWNELADRDIDVYHGGDAERVIPFPRPTWADADRDHIGQNIAESCYRSACAAISASWVDGDNDGDSLEMGGARVAAVMHGDGTTAVNLSVRKRSGTKEAWSGVGVIFTPAEAALLSDALLAAVDLIGGTS